MKLEIELIPESTFFKNVRSNVNPDRWNQIRYKCYGRANYRCEICNGIGPRWPVECHEEFSYNEETKIQKLERFIALCPNCHMVKHIGLAKLQGKYGFACKHFMKINNITKEEAELYIESVVKLWEYRSSIEWNLNLELLNTY